MARDFNQTILTGRLTRDPELKYTPNGQAVASFAIATNRGWTDGQGEKKEEVQYHDIVAWGKQAEFVSQYLGKGRKIMVIGRLQNRNWEAQDGTKRNKTEIVASEINFMDSKGSAQPTEGKEPKADAKEAKDEEINIDDIPF